ncbi:MAG TPA: type II toxin-antitoxin system VapB family antitoxin [Candidatus Baltobacteraceae bacterium]|nr:type II toxin-antitoxin system VapB family antitoxin [Candidatus Baltobacteraceae bacterium]
MALSIKDPETNELARQLASETGESITTAVSLAVRERLNRIRGRKGRASAVGRVLSAAWALPLLDMRSADEIVGYDERGLPSS